MTACRIGDCVTLQPKNILTVNATYTYGTMEATWFPSMRLLVGREGVVLDISQSQGYLVDFALSMPLYWCLPDWLTVVDGAGSAVGVITDPTMGIFE